jgi:hypothetical protein
MSFQENLELLSKADKFKITERHNDYIIEKKDYEGKNLIAEVDGESMKVKYYLSNCQNSIWDELPIDIDELEELKRFVELLQGRMGLGINET